MDNDANFKSRFPRDVLNEVKWKGHDLSKCKIHYINRGSPGDTDTIECNQIKEIGRGFLTIEGIPYEKYIPYHRITKIEYDGETIFDHP